MFFLTSWNFVYTLRVLKCDLFKTAIQKLSEFFQKRFVFYFSLSTGWVTSLINTLLWFKQCSVFEIMFNILNKFKANFYSAVLKYALQAFDFWFSIFCRRQLWHSVFRFALTIFNKIKLIHILWALYPYQRNPTFFPI